MARRALITGASRGIGRALAVELARRGWDLALTGRDQSALAAVAAECASANPQSRVLHRAFDMCDAPVFADFVGEAGAIDLYLSNHGILDGRRDGELIETADVAARVIAINLMSSVAALHPVVAAMRARQSGKIGIVASLGGLSPLADAPAYSASKAGLIAYGLALRDALRGSGVTVSVVCPGYVATDMAAEHNGPRPGEIAPEEAARRILAAVERGRRLTGFPFPLWPAALLAIAAPDALVRRFGGGLGFFVRKRD